MNLSPGLLVYGDYIGEETRTKKDGSKVVMVGVAVGISSYQVAVKPSDMPAEPWGFGDTVAFKVRAYTGQNGLYLTGYPISFEG